MVYQSSSRPPLMFSRPMIPRPYLIRICLQSLPVELICLILENLEMLDLVTCTMISKYLRRAVNESSKLQYTIELAKHRMLPLSSPSSAPSFSTRLNLLREREKAWKYLKFKKSHVLKLPPTGSVYEFVGGFYGNGREDETRATASISFMELPSLDAPCLADPQQDLQIWTHTMGDVTIIDFTMDPSQDLLVLVALAPPDSKSVYELHLRSIKTNQRHPKAPVAVLHCLASPAVPPQPSEIVAAVRVQVFGDLVALLIKEVFESTGAHLEIWNWESGSPYSSAMTRMSGIDDFTFLTCDSFLLVRPSGRFEVYSFTDPSNHHTVPVLRVSYAFPPLAEGFMYWYISMSSNPAPGFVPSLPKNAPPETLPGNSRQIYFPRPEERIHACCLYIFNPTHDENPVVHSFVFFVNLKTLMNPPTTWLADRQPSRRIRTRPSARWAVSVNSADIDQISNASNSPTASPTFVETQINNVASPSSPVNSQQQGSSSATSSSASAYPPFPTFDSAPQAPPLSPSDYTSPAYTLPVPSSLAVTPSATISTTPTPASGRRGHAPCIPWDVWGPDSTRWFEECLSTDWQHAIYGLRTVESVHPDKHPARLFDPVDDSNQPCPGISSEPATSSVTTTQAALGQPAPSKAEHPEDDDGNGTRSSSPRRYLRVRNFNTYEFKENDLWLSGSSEGTGDTLVDSVRRGRSGKIVDLRNGKGKSPVGWHQPRLVTGPSTTRVKGVFSKDIISSLPYTEVISEQTYEVTDVMMDDCRLLLLKRGKEGKLKRVEVLVT